MLDKVKEAHEILKAVQHDLVELVHDQDEGAPDVTEFVDLIWEVNRRLGHLVKKWEARERGE